MDGGGVGGWGSRRGNSIFPPKKWYRPKKFPVTVKLKWQIDAKISKIIKWVMKALGRKPGIFFKAGKEIEAGNFWPENKWRERELIRGGTFFFGREDGTYRGWGSIRFFSRILYTWKGHRWPGPEQSTQGTSETYPTNVYSYRCIEI